MKKMSMLALAAVLLIGTTACSKKVEQGPNSNVSTTFMHLHGLGYSADGKRLFIPVHNGLQVYSDGSWSEGPGEKHDYMGFTAVDGGFYSSGHPGPGSKFKNPLGLVKSTNDGKTISVLALEGEVDLHGMTAGYRSHTLYVANPEPNSKMKQAGLFYSKDEGKTWISSPATGLQGQMTAIAAHPSDAAIAAVGTTTGVYLSKDYGQRFTPLVPEQPVSALAFTDSGNVLAATSGPNASLIEINIESKQSLAIQTPSKDTITYVVQNPANPKELAIATEPKDVYLSTDRGATWIQIAENGKTINRK
ncbi:glycosyl hydrolase [Paenibacillus validus]|uniref:Glycosyl hydrolase n=2 Tax=Paenibacillus validus TaxID=44253 RepID=A0A7X2ZEB4_9BACL|nr:glycosyl hydrolase [Paenibacillus validus]MUG73311.1 glycosyl hydrolase [Paenibacillus validus]